MTPIKEAKTTTAFYGATPNYTFQLDDLGYVGLRGRLSACLRSGDSAKSQVLITRRDSRPVRHRDALGRPRLALARSRFEDSRALGRSGARGAPSGACA